jgi:hypothetical protein
MIADIHPILGRSETFPGEVRHAGQFTLGSATQAAADVVLGVGWSLYCLDIANDRAVFVELPADVDLARAPFAYAAQFAQAKRAAIVPLDALPALADQVIQTANVALLMSTGRCGSTLASRIFAQIPGVWSLSEPDWFTNLAFARFDLTPARLKMLIKSCTALSCRPPNPDQVQTVVLKPRSEMMVQASAYVDALPDANAVFLYRDCFGYVNSLYRFAQRMLGVKDPAPHSPEWEIGRQLGTINAPKAILADYFGPDEKIPFMDLMVLGWSLRMGAYLQATGGGMQVSPIHYADLNRDRAGQTHRLLESCGIDTAHLETALHGFDSDAHAGSAGENTVAAEPISETQRARIRTLLDRWGLPDYVDERLASLSR